MNISYVFNKDVYEQIGTLWNLTGVGNPLRGDTIEVIYQTLEQRGRILTLWEEQTLIGSAWLTQDGRRLYLHHMSIHPAYQGKGFSHLLMQESVAYGKELGLQIKLEVNKQNTAAFHLYQKYGFTEIAGYTPMIKRSLD